MPTVRSTAPRFLLARSTSASLARVPRGVLTVLTLLTVLTVSPAGVARAQDDCEPFVLRGPIEVMPAAGASGVLLDAPVRVRFTPDYFASPAAPLPEESIEVLDANGVPVAGELQLAGDDVLFFVPSGGWEPNALYEGVAFGELDLSFNFRTGTEVDVRAPSISPLTSLGSTRVDPSCQAPDGGFRLDLTFSVSQDDGASGSIEYHLYLARADGLEVPREVARQRNFTSDVSARVPISFVLDERYAAAPVCLQLQVSDSVGNVTVGTPYCFDPVEGANFAGLCAVGAGRQQLPGEGLLAWALLVLGLARRRTSRRRAVGRPAA